MEITPGKYIAKPIGGGMGTSKNGKFMIGIKFQMKEDPNKTIWWRGTMSGGGIEICTKTLAIVGFREDLPEQQEFGSEYLNAEKEVELDIREETYDKTDDNGNVSSKKFMKVAWVNLPGGGMKFGNVEPQELKSLIKNSNLKAELAKARRDLGMTAIKNHAPQLTKRREPEFDPNDESPF